MNSLLSGLGNTFMKSPMTQTPTQPQAPNILMQAIGAALRGESPQEFMSNLAKNHPQLKQYDLSNLQQTAQQICQQNGVDMQQVTNQLDNITKTLI